jgi:hypothetical protein
MSIGVAQRLGRYEIRPKTARATAPSKTRRLLDSSFVTQNDEGKMRPSLTQLALTAGTPVHTAKSCVVALRKSQVIELKIRWE